MTDIDRLLGRDQPGGWRAPLRRTQLDFDLIEKLRREPPVADEPVEAVRGALDWIIAHERDGRSEIGEMSVPLARLTFISLVHIGRMATAAAYVAACDRRLSPTWRPFGAQVVGSAPALPVVSRLGDDVDRDVQVVATSAATTFVLFCGVAHRFGVSLNILDLFLDGLAANVIYLRDRNQSLFLQGIRALGDFDTSVTRLRALLAKLGSARVVCIGNSAGVYGALLFATALPADQALCLAGPTTLAHGMEQKENRPIYLKLKQLVAARRIVVPDLPAALRRSGVPVRYICSEGNTFDRLQADTLKGIPDTVIETVPGAGHAVIATLAAAGKLRALFADLVDPPSAQLRAGGHR